MKNIILSFSIILVLGSCIKQEQIYEDNVGNKLTIESTKTDKRYSIQGTYYLQCTRKYGSLNGEYFEYTAELKSTPNNGIFTVAPLRKVDNKSLQNSLDNTFMIGTDGKISIPPVKFGTVSYHSIFDGVGAYNYTTKTMEFTLTNQDKSTIETCKCTAKKQQ